MDLEASVRRHAVDILEKMIWHDKDRTYSEVALWLLALYPFDDDDRLEMMARVLAEEVHKRWSKLKVTRRADGVVHLIRVIEPAPRTISMPERFACHRIYSAGTPGPTEYHLHLSDDQVNRALYREVLGWA